MKLKDVLKIKIGEKSFEVVKGEDLSIAKKHCIKNSGVELCNCYGRYSVAKQAIYDEWLRWAINNDCNNYFGVSGYNCMIFTLSCVCKCDIDNIIYITPSHNNFIISTDRYNELKNVIYELKKEFKQVLKQYDTKRLFNTFDPLYTFKTCIDNERDYFVNKYDILINKILPLQNNITDKVITTLYNEYIA